MASAALGLDLLSLGGLTSVVRFAMLATALILEITEHQVTSVSRASKMGLALRAQALSLGGRPGKAGCLWWLSLLQNILEIAGVALLGFLVAPPLAPALPPLT